MPPVTLPINTLQTFSRRLDTPPAPISSPARINSGIAIRGKESVPEMICSTMYCELSLPSARTATTAESPIPNPTGMFNINTTTSAKNAENATTIYFSPFPFLSV